MEMLPTTFFSLLLLETSVTNFAKICNYVTIFIGVCGIITRFSTFRSNIANHSIFQRSWRYPQHCQWVWPSLLDYRKFHATFLLLPTFVAILIAWLTLAINTRIFNVLGVIANITNNACTIANFYDIASIREVCGYAASSFDICSDIALKNSNNLIYDL